MATCLSLSSLLAGFYAVGVSHLAFNLDSGLHYLHEVLHHKHAGGAIDELIPRGTR
jgi:hypothetical protein